MNKENKEKTIFHIDVNSAYLSWSALKKLEEGDTQDLREIPSIIGGDMERRRGVVLAKSIPAKTYHVKTGEPIVSALRKCPHLTIAPPDHGLYHRKSQELMAFLYDICPDLEQVSVDECYMDYTPIAGKYASPAEAACIIKDHVYEKFGYTVNVGISNRKVLAKMASDFKKPNLVHTLYADEIQEKLWPLPVSSLYMCGRSSAETLRKLEILTIGDLARADTLILSAHLKSHGILLWEYANGIDSSVVISEQINAKGIGNSTTLREDVSTKEEACKVLLSLSETVAGRLRKSAQLAGMVSTELKYNTFQSVSHQTTLLSPTCTTDVIYKTACSLFDEIWNGTPLRLLGIRTSKLVSDEEPVQLSLFDIQEEISGESTSKKQEKLDIALDSIRKKFGPDSVIRGSLFHDDNL
ncbi:DNA polymerase-4 [Kineothrix alysoides]|uniref:DNA polymerase IV n=1 Tax=Kineothrix alysoides TaxID=1469948 RepID=A0A4R1R6S5_9FIRM|nr:DNA polymerase IV [Kineothrix alysoides]TCL61210.1 DNA polymerase-4 [Kineothrix alysoides]